MEKDNWPSYSTYLVLGDPKEDVNELHEEI